MDHNYCANHTTHTCQKRKEKRENCNHMFYTYKYN